MPEIDSGAPVGAEAAADSPAAASEIAAAPIADESGGGEAGAGEAGSKIVESAEDTAARLAGEKPADKAEDKAEDDPEIEYDAGKKLKRSELAARLKKLEGADEIYKGSRERFEQAANMRKEAQSIIAALQRDPMGVLQYLHQQGKLERDPLDAAADALEAVVKIQQMTPEQRQMWETQQELARFRQQHAEGQKAEQAKQYAAEQAQFEKQLDTDLDSAFKEFGLQKSISMLQRVGSRLSQLADKGQVPDTQTVRLAAHQAVQDLQAEIGQLAEALPADTVRKLFPGLVKKLHAADVQRVLAAQPPTARSVGKATQPKQKQPAAKPFASFKEMQDAFYGPISQE